jgi:MFS family permease
MEKTRIKEAEDAKSVRLVVLIVTTVSSFLTPFMTASVIVALPSIGHELRMDPVFLTWIASAFLLGVGVFLIPMGRLGDIHGRKKVYTIGIAIFGAMCLACAFTRSGYALVICRFFQGAAAAMTFGTGIAIVASVFPPSERGKALGINIGTVYLGSSLGPFLGGILTDHLGWRYVFLVGVPIVVCLLAVILWKMKQEWAEAKGEAFDYVGGLLYGGVLVALIFGMTWMPSLKGSLAILVGVLAAVFFIRWETSPPYPMLNMDLFLRNRLFAFSNLAGVINYSATYAIAFLISFYLQSVRAMTAQTAGIILVSQPIVQGILTPFLGRASDTTEPRIVASIGMAIIVVCLSLLATISAHTGIPYIVAILGILGLGFALFAAPNANAVMASVTPKFLGVASGTLVCTGTVGQILSMGITSLVFAVYFGNVNTHSVESAPLMGSMKILFVIFALISIVGLIVSAARGTVHKKTAGLSDPG